MNKLVHSAQRAYTSFAVIFAFCLIISCALPANGTDLSPNYSESLQLAISHAANPAAWQPASLYVIPDGGGTQGLIYDGGKLVVRTMSKSGNFSKNYAGQAGYKIYGSPTKDAAWVTVGNDATRFLLANGVDGSNVTALLERGLGMDTTGTHDAIIEYAVDTQYLMRPTRNPDITQYLPAQYGQSLPFVKPAGMSDAAFENFKAYYNYWLDKAYNSYAFPFTQLGYTLFWGNGYALANINGMTEFIVLGQSPVEIYGIYATRSYIYTRNDGTDFSTAGTASYGNGFASFKIDGTCDTVWAGHRFQKNVRTTTGTPNQVIIESGGTVSGGQGLLIWSLNYDVINNGIISGATTNKFGIGGTANVAVLFKGDTSTTYGTPITTAGAVNRLTNAGTISSPGAAIQAEGGDTQITNNSGGIISGGTYAIKTGTGSDTVTVNGGQITGNIDLGTGTDTLNVTGTNAAIFTFGLNRDVSTTARIVNAETVSIADNTNLGVTLSGPTVRDRDRFLIVDTDTLTATPGNLLVTNDPSAPMLTFSPVKDGNKLYLVASRNSTYYRQYSGNASLGGVLDSLANSTTGDFANVLGDLDRSGSAANARSLEPAVDQGAIQVSFGTVGRFTENIVNRIDQVWAGNAGGTGRRGISTGDEAAKWGVWTQGFGAYLNQEPRESSMGYTANIWGGSVGADRLVSDHFLLGLSSGYAKSLIRTSDTNTRTDADSYQGSVYGSLFKDVGYIDGILSYAYNRYDASRHILFGTVTDRVARSNYSGHQYSGYLEGGYNFKKGPLDITPLASIQYSRLHLKRYSETGADSLNLVVDAQDYDMLQSGLGAKFSYPVSCKGAQIIPEVHLKWLYDFIGDRQQATSTFTGGGASFSTEGYDPPKSSYNAGARLTVLMKQGVMASFNYDFEMKRDFYSHAGYANIHFTF